MCINKTLPCIHKAWILLYVKCLFLTCVLVKRPAVGFFLGSTAVVVVEEGKRP